MIEQNYGYEVLADGYGLDYADSAVVTPTPPNPSNFLPLALEASPCSTCGTAISCRRGPSRSATRCRSATERPTRTPQPSTRSTADITGAPSATSPWPMLTQASIFMDGVLYDTLVVGLANSNIFGGPDDRRRSPSRSSSTTLRTTTATIASRSRLAARSPRTVPIRPAWACRGGNVRQYR